MGIHWAHTGAIGCIVLPNSWLPPNVHGRMWCYEGRGPHLQCKSPRTQRQRLRRRRQNWRSDFRTSVGSSEARRNQSQKVGGWDGSTYPKLAM